MKNKKQIAVVIIFIGLLQLSIQSCKKYPDGPSFSLISRSERVANNWVIDNYKVNGDDYTSLVNGYVESFTKNGAYSYSWGILNGSGTWVFQNNDNEIKLTGSDSHASRTLYILKLEEKSFWYYVIDGNDKKEFHMNQK